MSAHLIETNKFELDEKVYFKILFRTRLRELWWFYFILIALVVWNIEDFGKNSFSTYMVILGGLYPLFSFFYLYGIVTSKKNRALFTPRILQFNDNFLITLDDEGTEQKVPINKIVRIVETRTFFLLYRTEYQFLYVPKNSFKTDKDLEAFGESIKRSLAG